MECMDDYGSLSKRKHIEVHVDKITPLDISDLASFIKFRVYQKTTLHKWGV